MYKYLSKLILFNLFIMTNSLNINRRTIINGFAFGTYNNINNKLNGDNTIDILNTIKKENTNQEQVSESGLIQDISNNIYFYAPLNQRSCFELKNKLNELELQSNIFSSQYESNPPPIHLHIQSEGGSLYHTLYIIDLIQNLKTPVYTYIDGFAASAATLISVVGDKRFMTKNSLMLIHQLSGSDSGKYNELKDQMTNMNILMSIIRNTYLNNTKLTPDKLDYLLEKDLWLEAEVCLKYGLVDEII